MSDSTQPDVMANVITILIGCVAAFVSIGRKIDRSRTKLSWLWLSTEIGSCILAGFIGHEAYHSIPSVSMLSWMPKSVFVILCVYSGSRLVIRLEEKANKAFPS